MTDIAAQLAPSGPLRAVINIHNSILASRQSDAGTVSGLPVDLAEALADRLGIPLQLSCVSGAQAAFDLIADGKADVGFLAVAEARAGKVEFTTPFIQFEATYLSPQGSLHAVGEADAEGNRIAVLQGSGPDLHLSKTLASATLVRRPTPASALEAVLTGKADMLAGNRHALVAMAAGTPGLAVAREAFMTVGQAICVPRGRPDAVVYLSAFVEEMKASGMVSRCLQRSGQDPALVAPPSRQSP